MIVHQVHGRNRCVEYFWAPVEKRRRHKRLRSRFGRQLAMVMTGIRARDFHHLRQHDA